MCIFMASHLTALMVCVRMQAHCIHVYASSNIFCTEPIVGYSLPRAVGALPGLLAVDQCKISCECDTYRPANVQGRGDSEKIAFHCFVDALHLKQLVVRVSTVVNKPLRCLQDQPQRMES